MQSIADDSEDVDAIERAIEAAQAEQRGAVADHRPQPHRLRRAEGGRHAKSHGSPLGEEEVAATKQALGLDPDKHFDVAPEVYEHMDMRPQGIAWQQVWQRGSSAGRRRSRG